MSNETDRRRWPPLRRYPAAPIPAGEDMVGNYHYVAIAAAHTPADLADFSRWMDGQTMVIDSQGQTVIFARDYERWVAHRRV